MPQIAVLANPKNLIDGLAHAPLNKASRVSGSPALGLPPVPYPRPGYEQAREGLLWIGRCRAHERPIPFRSPAQKEWVDTALVIAIDSSNSIESDTLDLQFRATLAALESPSVLDAIQGGYYGCIAASIVIWSTRFRQDTIANWKKICSREDMLAFTANAKHPYYDHLHHHGSTTSLAGAIEYALNMLADCPFKAEGRVIDVSGNGVESSTTSGLKYLKKCKQQAESTSITINGLPIITPRSEHDLVSFYKRNIVTQDGFLIIATHLEDFQKAVERKFWIDIAFSGKLAAPAAHLLKPDELFRIATAARRAARRSSASRPSPVTGRTSPTARGAMGEKVFQFPTLFVAMTGKKS